MSADVEVTNVVEHEDGSATYTFDMIDEARDRFADVGIKFALYAGAFEKTTDELFEILERELLKDENPVSEG